ncbi:response regulator [Roseivirga pacifica]|uniref:response regulator n=1 Tax=Roseivirga pacifica TaxID=1267423 RepID=UPI002095BD2C|nr:response regulator [Roseivirga pacifica]MCO6360229.1 response regulator [Roseivirga pacifica]MCO6367600.1 response regulator [Roseivirga pacifica]MCO6369868.1 response regulator [Roseivirga pacifica]MCO6375257.1 response regulator [Roseivirga pacifica]MCO6380515.1 response regulator [Roseivirga pacifica]
MNHKLKCIMLIDDDEPTNYLNKMVIEEAACAEQCITIENAKEALNYLKTFQELELPRPDLIFLDINMPAMNGWEFLNAYETLNEDQKGRVVIIMLTTSLNPDDMEKARNYQDVDGYKSKPLSLEMIQEVIKTHFS